MSGKPGQSGGARRGAGRAPVLKFRNKQTVRVAGLWGGKRQSAWRNATISIKRGAPDRVQMDIIDGDEIIRLLIVI